MFSNSHIPWRQFSAWSVAALAFLLFAFVGPVAAAPKDSSPSDIAGSYEVTVKGSVTGKGTIAVGASSVTIVLHVTDESGATGKLMASNLTLKDGRFSGTGTVMGVAMTISGRVDPADASGPLRAATLAATYSTESSGGGRIVGTRRGTGPKP